MGIETSRKGISGCGANAEGKSGRRSVIVCSIDEREEIANDSLFKQCISYQCGYLIGFVRSMI